MSHMLEPDEGTANVLKIIKQRVREQNYTKDAIGDTIVMFFHIPKTGGTSINSAFITALPEKDIFTERYFGGQVALKNKKNPMIEALSNPKLTLTKGKVTYIEVHGYFPLLKDIPFRTLKENIRAHHGNLFTFAVLRDPVDTARSYCQYVCDFYPLANETYNKTCTNESPIEIFYRNTQLNYITGRSVPSPYLPRNVTADELRQAISSLNKLDHIGFKETFEYTFHKIRQFLAHSSPSFNLSAMEVIPHANVHHGGESDSIFRRSRFVGTQDQDILLYNYFFSRRSEEEIMSEGQSTPPSLTPTPPPPPSHQQHGGSREALHPSAGVSPLVRMDTLRRVETDYALFGVMALVMLVAFRRWRRSTGS